MKKLSLLMITCMANCLVFAASSPSGEKSAYMSCSNMAEVIKGIYSGIDSLSVSYYETVVSAESANGDPSVVDGLVRHSYVERVEKGDLFYIKYSIDKTGFENPAAVMEHSFDGRNLKNYFPQSKDAENWPDLTGRDVETKNALNEYMFSFKVGKKGAPHATIYLANLLANSAARRRPNLEVFTNKINQVTTNKLNQIVTNQLTKIELAHVVDFTGPRHGLLTTLWICVEKGCLPLKYISVDNGVVRKTMEVQEIGSVNTPSGETYFYPARATRMINTPRIKIRYQLTTYRYLPNVTVTSNSFSYPFPEGSRLCDTLSEQN